MSDSPESPRPPEEETPTRSGFGLKEWLCDLCGFACLAANQAEANEMHKEHRSHCEAQPAERKQAANEPPTLAEMFGALSQASSASGLDWPYRNERGREILRALVSRLPALLAADTLTESAWEIIASVSRSNWSRQPIEWQDAARRWRDDYHKTLLARSPEGAP